MADLKDLQKELFERKLYTMDYFGVGFDAFGILLKENKALMFFAFLLKFSVIALTVLVFILKNLIEMGWYDYFIFLLLFLALILYIACHIISAFFKGYFFRKVGFKFENNKDKLDLGKVFVKSLIILGIYALTGVFQYFSSKAAVRLFNILQISVTIWALLYFFGIYYIRDLGFVDSLNYSLKLSSGNRFRIIVPAIYFTIIFGLGIGIMMLIYMSELPFAVSVIFSIILFAIAAVVLMYMDILSILIFLNVENDYLKEEWTARNENKENNL